MSFLKLTKRTLPIAVLFFCISILFSSCGNESDRAYLDSGWYYTLDDPATTPAGKIKYKPLEYSQLADLKELIPGGTGFIWLKNEFSVPSYLRHKNTAIYLGRITMADETSLNGSVIGGEGRFPPNEWSAWNTVRNYSIPNGILQEKNLLLIKIYSHGECSLTSRPFLGLAQDVSGTSKYNNFINSTIHLLFAFFMILTGLYFLNMYLRRREEYETLIFALINFVSAVYLSVFYIQEIPGLPTAHASFLWFQKIFSNAMIYFMPFMVTLFVNSFLHRKDNKIILILRLVFMIVPVVIILLAKDYVKLTEIKNLLLPALVPPMLYILFLLIRAAVKKENETFALLVGFSPLVLTVLIDLIIHSSKSFPNAPYFTSFGWQLAVITLQFIMAGRFANARRRAEYLNEHLEKEVQDRTQKLTESNSKLEATNAKLATANSDLESANGKLAQANGQLEEANGKLADAKRKSDRDMQLAVYVQNSFYQRTAPKVDGWDIAYTFKPMSGVSGDLYDFFTKGKQLMGLGLFDVSGHGISSGLVTMLAKTVIDRKFTECFDKPLPVAVKEINDTLVEEKGDIENYMTGVLLKTEGSKVSLTNAGHPTVYIRKSAAKKSYPVTFPEGQDDSAFNSIIGIAGMDAEFKALKFEMKKGDSIILYSDCLSESVNKAGDQFSQEKVGEVFAQAGDGSAKDQLDYVLSKFDEYTSGVPLNDDLTVVVLKRTE